jgi:hypothetical protein
VRKAVVVLGVLVGVGSFVPFSTEIGDGAVPLSVTVRSARETPLGAVSVEAFGNPAEAEEVLADLIPPETALFSARSEPFDGNALVVQVPTSYHLNRALLWTYGRSYQYRKLVVIVQYADGKREGQLVDIPDIARSRELIVEFPGSQNEEQGASK